MGFESCHPAINLIYFTAVICSCAAFDHPMFLMISFICAFSYSVKRNGKRGLIFNTILIPLAVLFGFYYSSYNHFGVTVINENYIGNSFTAESFVYGMVLGLKAIDIIMWMSVVYSIFSSDKAVYLFGRISPKLSLYFSVLLRMLPRVKREAVKINSSRTTIGKGAGQGNVLCRTKNALLIFSILITWTIEAMASASDSMQSRGNLLKGRTAFSIYRFDNRDRLYTIIMFCALTLTLVGILLGQTKSVYDPMMIFPPVTPLSYLIFAGYGLLCIMPLCFESYTEHRFNRKRVKVG